VEGPAIAATTSSFFLGIVFLAAGVVKLANLRDFAQTVGQVLPVNARIVHGIALGAPVAECLAGLLLLGGSRLGALAAFLLLGLFSLAAGISGRRGKQIRCSCFGPLSGETLGKATVYRNGVLAMVAGVALVSQPAPTAPARLTGILSAAVFLAVTACLPFIVTDRRLLDSLAEQTAKREGRRR
jgi:uncharacterized membrane protein HdeD (DUF308 family)